MVAYFSIPCHVGWDGLDCEKCILTLLLRYWYFWKILVAHNETDFKLRYLIIKNSHPSHFNAFIFMISKEKLNLESVQPASLYFSGKKSSGKLIIWSTVLSTLTGEEVTLPWMRGPPKSQCVFGSFVLFMLHGQVKWSKQAFLQQAEVQSLAAT